MKRLLIASTLAVALVSSASAESFNCGRYMSSHFGIKPIPLALNWAKAFPHTNARPGVVVVQRRKGRALGGSPGGHVSKIVSLSGHCRAVVLDNRGTYERDICRALVAYVDPNGNRLTSNGATE